MLFPYTMLSTAIFDSITVPFIALAIIQFPLYGVALGYANQKGRFGWVAILLGVVHGLAWLVMSSLATRNFS
jgi:ABC-type sulfate transport system permease subunit